MEVSDLLVRPLEGLLFLVNDQTEKSFDYYRIERHHACVLYCNVFDGLIEV